MLEFDLEFWDKKGANNQVDGDEVGNVNLITEDFPDEQLLIATTLPWYVDIINFLVSRRLPLDLNIQGRRKFLHDAKFYFWDEPYLYKQCANQII
ncbi:Retrovirus-related Pol polyprotein from transposon opus [Gossypium australe]|uniref:Retrovirus-related Pol polyprotein from transposon opus n=1 Tax=Gossypium australe TaxID=47621 RepID=A0A5B6WRX3_9ROSI|nr:Retrovirus-related Pol polyprotein from transposon opus [Gossypium australe]